VTTVIRNPLLRLGLERILDDLGLTSVTHHDGPVLLRLPIALPARRSASPAERRATLHVEAT